MAYASGKHAGRMAFDPYGLSAEFISVSDSAAANEAKLSNILQSAGPKG